MKTFTNRLSSLLMTFSLMGGAYSYAYAKAVPKQDTREALYKKTAKAARSKAHIRAKALRKKLNEDGIMALSQVEEAEALLQNKHDKKALTKLESAMAKIEAAIASNAQNAFLPVDSIITANEYLADAKQVKRDLKFVNKMLKESKVQDARKVLTGMKSEITIATTYLPLAAYPPFIRQAINDLSHGKRTDAQDDLLMARSSLVSEVDTFPIPLLNAKEAFFQAKAAMHQKKQDVKMVEKLINFSQDQLTVAAELGYISKDSKKYKEFWKDLSKIKSTVDKKSKHSLFGSLFKSKKDNA